MEWELLEKTTFWIDNIEFNKADLGNVASAAAQALGLQPTEVMVVDVRPGLVAFDILRHKVAAEAVAGKQAAIIEILGNVPGVTVDKDSCVHSEGVLGLIALDPSEASKVLADSARMAAEISRKISRRALVFASGKEIKEGKIRDTNSPYIIKAMQVAGLVANFGGIIEDDVRAAEATLRSVIEQGFGWVVTTGGVGAENKDFNVEAICQLDPSAATPWILKFQADYQRHHKEGVRIAVGSVGLTHLVALPGPHEEAKISCSRLLEGIETGMGKEDLAEHIASALRARWHTLMHRGIHE